MTALSTQPGGTPAKVATATRRLTIPQRVLAGLIAVACLAVLGTGARLTPAAAGHGTHSQLGLPACGWVQAINVPCPTCGMTTAVSYAAHGRPLESLRAQPAGFVMAIGLAAGFWVAMAGAATGARVQAMLGFLVRPRVLCILGAVWIGSWVYKIVTWPA